MTKALPFTKAAVKRAVDAARKAGLHVTGFSIDTQGTVHVSCGDNPSPSVQPDSIKEHNVEVVDKWADAT